MVLLCEDVGAVRRPAAGATRNVAELSSDGSVTRPERCGLTFEWEHMLHGAWDRLISLCTRYY